MWMPPSALKCFTPNLHIGIVLFLISMTWDPVESMPEIIEFFIDFDRLCSSLLTR